MGKENVVHTYNKILVSFKTNYNHDILKKSMKPKKYAVPGNQAQRDKYDMFGLVCVS